MFDRSEATFIFLWVINPLVILFYQNCSSIPQGYAAGKHEKPSYQQAQAPAKFERSPACHAPNKDCAQQEQ